MKGVSTYCHIENACYVVNGEVSEVFASSTNEEVASFLYKKLDLGYPKFHKMDLLAKVAFLGVEIMKRSESSLSNYGEDDVALLFANKESSQYSDDKFQESYLEKGNPSPSQFVYTLPNIMMGEIAIRNKWYGENLFLLFPEFNEEELMAQLKMLFAKGCKAVVLGWVNVCEKQLDTFFAVVNHNSFKELKSSELKQLYTK